MNHHPQITIWRRCATFFKEWILNGEKVEIMMKIEKDVIVVLDRDLDQDLEEDLGPDPEIEGIGIIEGIVEAEVEVEKVEIALDRDRDQDLELIIQKCKILHLLHIRLF